MLVRYIRDENRKPIGCVVAIDRDHISWSQCNPKAPWGKSWNKSYAIDSAALRAKYAKPILAEYGVTLESTRELDEHLFGRISEGVMPTEKYRHLFRYHIMQMLYRTTRPTPEQLHQSEDRIHRAGMNCNVGVTIVPQVSVRELLEALRSQVRRGILRAQ